MGARLLKRWITPPLKNIEAITDRLNCVEYFKKDAFCRAEVELLLKRVADIERLISRISFERANARDLIALKNSFSVFPKIVKALGGATVKTIKELLCALEGFDSLQLKIESTIVDNPPLSIREGGMIKSGVSEELDQIIDMSRNGKQWIAKLQETEREKTGISSLKSVITKCLVIISKYPKPI
jgi:DNA mismatch repair protein MutS